jgi:hypothetical protein
MPALARPGDPYVTDKGDVMLEGEGQPMNALPRADSVLGAPLAKHIVPKSRRNVADLPAPGKLQTAINVVLIYQLLGLSENEIAHLVDTSIADIQKIKSHIAYQETFDALFHEFISVNSNSLQSKIAAFAGDALDNVMDIAKSSKHEMAKLKANQDILDRSGLHPEHLFGKNKEEDGFDSLKIVVQSGEDKEMSVDVDIKRR